MSIYDINYRDFVADYLPPDKREERQIAWLTALLIPLDQKHVDTFGAYRDDVIYRAKQNGQRILLESILNDTFNVVAAPYIYIDNTGDDVTSQIFFNESEGLEPVWFFQESEGQPVYFNQESELTNNRQFKVYVPTAVYSIYGEDAIRAEVDRLRPYSTFYTIIQY